MTSHEVSFPVCPGKKPHGCGGNQRWPKYDDRGNIIGYWYCTFCFDQARKEQPLDPTIKPSE